MPQPRDDDRFRRGRAAGVAGDVLGAALPLEYADDLDPLLDRIGDARCVLIGAASHGTHEYCAWRAALTRRLVGERGFAFVAVEGDWPDGRRVGRSVALAPGAPGDPRDVLAASARWPAWMWANEETAGLCRWLRDRNAALPPGARTGFYGLDVYGLWESLRAVADHLAEHRPDRLDAALEAFRCFEPRGAEDGADDGRRAALVPDDGTADEVLALLTRLRRPVTQGGGREPVDAFDAGHNAEVAADAERYYRTMIAGGPDAWNARDVHLAGTLDRLMEFHASEQGTGKAVVWAHDTQAGDARATGMAASGMTSLGRLARERYGRDRVVLVGFAGGPGEVVAAPRWGAPMEVMHVPPPEPGSLEARLAETELHRGLFIVPPEEDKPAFFTDTLGERAIGAVYDPDRDARQFVPARLADRYDALCWFRFTSALQPLHLDAARRGEPAAMPSWA